MQDREEGEDRPGEEEREGEAVNKASVSMVTMETKALMLCSGKVLGTRGLTTHSGPPSSPEGSSLPHPGGWELPSAPAAPAGPGVTAAHPRPWGSGFHPRGVQLCWLVAQTEGQCSSCQGWLWTPCGQVRLVLFFLDLSATLDPVDCGLLPKHSPILDAECLTSLAVLPLS